MDSEPDRAGTIPAAESDDTEWVFGYGSLIYKVDFPWIERETATLSGWERRFWQGSHDHRGTPEAPGRVVTLTRAPGAQCRGVAYRVASSVFAHLDHREKNGYERHITRLYLDHLELNVTGNFYIAAADNPAFLGPADPDAIARQIARSTGPSGSNIDYVLQLAQALRELDEIDPHVFDLESRLLVLQEARVS
jgi:cation transport protein ChaC